MSDWELLLTPSAGWGANLDGQGFTKLQMGPALTRKDPDKARVYLVQTALDFSELGAEGTIYRLGGMVGGKLILMADTRLFQVGLHALPTWNFHRSALDIDVELSGDYLIPVRNSSRPMAVGIGLFGRITAVGELGSGAPIVGAQLSLVADPDYFF